MLVSVYQESHGFELYSGRKHPHSIISKAEMNSRREIHSTPKPGNKKTGFKPTPFNLSSTLQVPPAPLGESRPPSWGCSQRQVLWWRRLITLAGALRTLVSSTFYCYSLLNVHFTPPGRTLMLNFLGDTWPELPVCLVGSCCWERIVCYGLGSMSPGIIGSLKNYYYY